MEKVCQFTTQRMEKQTTAGALQERPRGLNQQVKGVLGSMHHYQTKCASLLISNREVAFAPSDRPGSLVRFVHPADLRAEAGYIGNGRRVQRARIAAAQETHSSL